MALRASMRDVPVALEEAAGLDKAAGPLGRVASAVLPEGGLRDALQGRWLGHPLHPVLTDVTIGFWTSASVLDLLGRRRARPAASMFVALGVLSAAPTVATGLAEVPKLDAGARRVAVVHATANAVATALYARSWSARRNDHHAGGVLLALAGMGVATVGGLLGGHLAFGTDEEPGADTGDVDASAHPTAA
jgi:uncharacterized membrane protein